MKNKLKFVGLVAGDIILALILAANLQRMFSSYLKLKAAASAPLLSDNAAEFANKLADMAVPWWAWAINVGGLAVTLTLLVLLFIPATRSSKLMITNAVWLVLWLIYFLWVIILLAMVASSLLSS